MPSFIKLVQKANSLIACAVAKMTQTLVEVVILKM